LHHAQAIAATYRADLHVVNVVPDVVAPFVPLGGPLPMLTPGDVRPATQEALDRWVANAGVAGPVETAVRQGVPVLEILEYADEMCADLIVTGTRGHSGLDHIMLGSTAERLVHRAKCPVLTVPRAGDEAGSADFARFTHVLAAVDFSPSALAALRLGQSIAREHAATLTVLHVLELLSDEEARAQAHYRVGEYVAARRQEALEQLETCVPPDAAHWYDVSAIVELGSAARVILKEADERNADLIVMGSQGHSGLGLALFGSCTQTVLRSAAVPVLTTRAAAVSADAPAVATMRKRAALSRLI
jgi:nucleotide-binding universal stress UspA family protein